MHIPCTFYSEKLSVQCRGFNPALPPPPDVGPVACTLHSRFLTVRKLIKKVTCPTALRIGVNEPLTTCLALLSHSYLSDSTPHTPTHNARRKPPRLLEWRYRRFPPHTSLFFWFVTAVEYLDISRSAFSAFMDKIDLRFLSSFDPPSSHSFDN